MSDSNHQHLAYFEQEMHSGLPRPTPDTPEERARLQAAASAAFEALNPGDAMEAGHAVQWVVMHAAALQSQELARRDPLNTRHARQARTLLGFADSALKFLIRAQTERMKREAAAAAEAKAETAEQKLLRTLRSALAKQKPRRQPPKPD
jgi:hypothetical protein